MSTARVASERRSSKSASHVSSTHSSARRRARSGLSAVAEPCERAFEHVDALVVDPTGDAVPAPVVPQRGAHEEVDRVDVVGEAAGREQGLAVRGITRLPLRVAEPEEQRGPTVLVVGRRPIEQVERISVPAQRLVGRELGQGPIARLLRVRDRLARVRGLGA